MLSDINTLDDLANRMRVTWRKANNFYSTFAGDFIEVQNAFNSGRFGDMSLAAWMFSKVGVFERSALDVLKAHKNVLAYEEREKLEQQRMVVAAERAKMKEQRAIEIAERKRKREIKKVEKEAKIAQVKFEAEAATNQRKKQRELSVQRHYEKAESQKAAYQSAINGLHNTNPRAFASLTECANLERATRIELGRKYLELRKMWEQKKFGDDPNTNKPWRWGAWCKLHIPTRSQRDVDKCIAEAIDAV